MDAHQAAQEKDLTSYIPLYKAALRGDWEAAKSFIDLNEEAATARICKDSKTALHIIIGTGKSIHFVKNLVSLMPCDALAMQDEYGNTVLNIAGLVGNTAAAMILVEKNGALLHIKHNLGFLPVHRAALSAHKETLVYLLGCHYKDDVNPRALAGQDGVELLINVIDSGFFDVALALVQRYPNLATSKTEKGEYACLALAKKTSAFPSGSSLNMWQAFLYRNIYVEGIPVKFKDEYAMEGEKLGDVEDPFGNPKVFPHLSPSTTPLFQARSYTSGSSVWQKVYIIFLEAMKCLVPQIKRIESIKIKHHQALVLLEILCKKIRSLNNATACSSLYAEPIIEAAKLGIHEVVETIVGEFPDAAYSRDQNGYYIFENAVINCCVKIFNLIYQMSDFRQYTTLLIDKEGNNILHFAGRLAPSHKLNLIPGAALQMQSEIKWFKEVEKFVIPTYKEKRNSDNETPAMVFTRAHKDLIITGEKWMKDAANSCTIAAALMATIAFAASITVPGGTDRKGYPNLDNREAFTIFAITDAVSLFTSCTSLLMFLSILTSRYAESDFLLVLPRRLIFGLVTMFIAITTMMMSFSATFYLMFQHQRIWHMAFVLALASLPVTSFVLLQFPLLTDVILSTYGRGIFGKQSDKPFY